MFGRATIRLGIGPHFSFVLIVEPYSYIVNRQIGVWDFKYVRKICPYAYVTLYGACAVVAIALSLVACG